MANVYKKISVSKAIELISANGSKMLSITFTKKDGKTRTINGVIKPSSSPMSNQGYLTIKEASTRSYRKANFQTMTTLKCGGNCYRINRTNNVGKTEATSV